VFAGARETEWAGNRLHHFDLDPDNLAGRRLQRNVHLGAFMIAVDLACDWS
jgi:hypothetical protein